MCIILSFTRTVLQRYYFHFVDYALRSKMTSHRSQKYKEELGFLFSLLIVDPALFKELSMGI